MEVTRDFLVNEITRMEGDRDKASSFVTAISGAIDGYRALVERLDAPFELVPEQEEVSK